jgi:hypothetical protein
MSTSPSIPPIEVTPAAVLTPVLRHDLGMESREVDPEPLGEAIS